MVARTWLRENGYRDVADLIDEVMADLEEKGSKQRRNWWDVLAGGPSGHAIAVAGRAFPVLKAAQRRQGRRVTSNAIQRNAREVPPKPRKTGRWKSDS